MTNQPTKPIKITKFIALEASGVGISDPTADSGYNRHLVSELHRIGANGGTVYLSANGLDDLAEWLDTMEVANGSSGAGNFAGARACAKLAEKARRYAGLLRGEQDSTTNNQKEASMATVTRKKGAAKTAAKKAAAVKTTVSNGRRAAENWDNLVDEIREARQSGTTMKDLKTQYGVSSDVPLREALARAGYDSKGDALEYDDISGLRGAPLKNRIVKERKEGTAWYLLALMTGKSESELRSLAGDAGTGGGGRKAATAKTAKQSTGKKITRRKGKKEAVDPSATD